jgi:hypothetical protein
MTYSGKKARVLIGDDSAVLRKVLDGMVQFGPAA